MGLPILTEELLRMGSVNELLDRLGRRWVAALLAP
jgi:hypothetical protein